MSKFAVGDTVVYVPATYGLAPKPQQRTIAKVGRKYAYITGVDWEQRIRFSIDTGYGGADSNYRARIYTPSDYEAEQHRVALLERFRAHQRTLDRPSRIPTPTLEKLLAVLDAAAEADQ